LKADRFKTEIGARTENRSQCVEKLENSSGCERRYLGKNGGLQDVKVACELNSRFSADKGAVSPK